MINIDRDKYIDKVARIFNIAISYKVHFQVITDILSKSELIENIEKNNYSILINNSAIDLVNYLYNVLPYEDESYFNYNDAYWCGYVYMNLFYKFKKPFSYIFLKLPLKELIDMYPLYHETDLSQVYDLFIEKEKNTIMNLLVKKHKTNLGILSEKTKIKHSTLSSYKESDQKLYKGSFQNLHRIALVLDEPDSLFLEELL